MTKKRSKRTKNSIQNLKGFYYAAKLNSVSKAAEALNLGQSTITLQIQSLEKELGTKLFKRSSKPLTLTRDGEEFYKQACPLVQEFESVVDNFLKHKKKKKQNKIDIAVHHIAISYLMPSIIAAFSKMYPDTHITIRNIAQDDAINRLKNEEIDLSIYPTLGNDPEIEYIEVASYNPTLIMRKGHPLDKKELETIADLKDYNLIRIDPNLITLPLFENYVKTYDLKGTIHFENGSWEMLKRIVRKNDHIALVSTLCIEENDELATKNLSNFFPKASYSIMHKKKIAQSPLIKDFVKIVQSTVKHH